MIKTYHNGETYAFVNIYSNTCIGVDTDISKYQTETYKHHVFYSIGALNAFLGENHYKIVHKKHKLKLNET